MGHRALQQQQLLPQITQSTQKTQTATATKIMGTTPPLGSRWRGSSQSCCRFFLLLLLSVLFSVESVAKAVAVFQGYR